MHKQKIWEGENLQAKEQKIYLYEYTCIVKQV